MKNRRIVVTAIMLIALLCVGMGYAALTDTITATGTITYDAENFDLIWQGNVDGEDVTTQTTDSDTLAFSVNTSYWEIGTTKTYTVKVANENTKYNATGVTVSAATGDALANYGVTAEISNATINAGATATVTFKITLNEYPTTETYSETFSFTVSNTSVTSVVP